MINDKPVQSVGGRLGDDQSAESPVTHIDELFAKGMRQDGLLHGTAICARCGADLDGQPRLLDPGTDILVVLCPGCRHVLPLGRRIYESQAELWERVLGVTVRFAAMWLTCGLFLLAAFAYYGLLIAALGVELDLSLHSGGQQIRRGGDAAHAWLYYGLWAGGTLFVTVLVGAMITSTYQTASWKFQTALTWLPLALGLMIAAVRLKHALLNQPEYGGAVARGFSVVILSALVCGLVVVWACRRDLLHRKQQRYEAVHADWEKNQQPGLSDDSNEAKHPQVVEKDVTCAKCEYSLKGLQTKPEERTGLMVVECPECGSKWPVWGNRLVNGLLRK